MKSEYRIVERTRIIVMLSKGHRENTVAERLMHISAINCVRNDFMRLLKHKQTMLYQKRILLTIAALLVVVILIYSTVIYYSTERTVLGVQDDANMKVLSQVNYNIDNIYVMVQNLANYLYFDNTISSLLIIKDLNEISPLDYINKIRQLNNINAISPFLDSIILYNCNIKNFFSTGTDISLYNKPLTDELMKHMSRINLMNTEFTTINYVNEQKNTVTLFTFILRDWSQKTSSGKSAVIVNIKLDWLFSSINTINKIGQNSQSHLYIMDGNKKVYSNITGINKDKSNLEDSVKDEISNSQKNSGFFTYEGNGGNQLVSYIKNSKSGWCIISEQPYNALFSQINNLRTTFILLTLCILIAAIILSFYFSKRLYKPLREMLRHFRVDQGISGEGAEGKDELQYMTKVYDQTVLKLTSETNKTYRNRRYIDQYTIMRLLTDSLSVTEKELLDNEKGNTLKIDLKSRLMVVILKIDDYIQFSSYTGNEKNLYRFAIKNISEEIFSQEFPCESVDMRGDNFVLLFMVKEEPLQIKTKINGLITELQKAVYEYYRISMTAAYDDTASLYSNITNIYNQALYNANYRLIYGKRSIISSAMIKENESHKDIKLPVETEKKLVEAIKYEDNKQIGIQLDIVFNCISKMKYCNMIYLIRHMVLLISQTVIEINSNRINMINLDMQRFNTDVGNCETLAEIKELFKDMMLEISEKKKGIPDDRNEVLADTICGIIEDNYQDVKLCLQWIATSVKLSSSYVGKVFKNSKQISVAEYINEIRLKHTLELLQNEEISINRTFEVVGFTSQSYFFTLFKKKYGCTPKEYRLLKAIRMNNEF